MAFLLFLMSFTANAGEIHVQSDEGVRVEINDQPIGFDGFNNASAYSLQSGLYDIQVIGPYGRLLAEQRVNLSADERRDFSYSRGLLYATQTSWIGYAAPQPVRTQTYSYQVRRPSVHAHHASCGHAWTDPRPSVRVHYAPRSRVVYHRPAARSTVWTSEREHHERPSVNVRVQGAHGRIEGRYERD